ncbi:MAG: biopolymer transporter ExbD [Phenylobacterium sp.]|uniref:biopolymer transporter ExbD n=1 Tax=Phenylobacterium sp. TaxID=1871053 RepID=UPI001A61B0C3|nr:biopolymer transporter ExbD [Phenylobacterium sp.]MBL8773548.1 biopolymer transporter ExbD [Phenylobacterium sp.]
MAASLASHSHGAYAIRQNAEINVTPFVDVMLVLLIIFMVALPVSTVSVRVDLPPVGSTNAVSAPPVVVSVTLDGRAFVGDRATTLGDLPAAVGAAIGGPNPTSGRIYLRGDEGVAYGKVIAVMNALQAAGYHKVALVGEAL